MCKIPLQQKICSLASKLEKEHTGLCIPQILWGSLCLLILSKRLKYCVQAGVIHIGELFSSSVRQVAWVRVVSANSCLNTKNRFWVLISQPWTTCQNPMGIQGSAASIPACTWLFSHQPRGGHFWLKAGRAAHFQLGTYSSAVKTEQFSYSPTHSQLPSPNAMGSLIGPQKHTKKTFVQETTCPDEGSREQVL